MIFYFYQMYKIQYTYLFSMGTKYNMLMRGILIIHLGIILYQNNMIKAMEGEYLSLGINHPLDKDYHREIYYYEKDYGHSYRESNNDKPIQDHSVHQDYHQPKYHPKEEFCDCENNNVVTKIQFIILSQNPQTQFPNFLIKIIPVKQSIILLPILQFANCKKRENQMEKYIVSFSNLQQALTQEQIQSREKKDYKERKICGIKIIPSSHYRKI